MSETLPSDPLADELARILLEKNPQYSSLNDPAYRMCENPTNTSKSEIANLRKCMSIGKKAGKLLQPYLLKEAGLIAGEVVLPCDEGTKIALKNMYPHLLFLWNQRNNSNGQSDMFQKIMESDGDSSEIIHIGYEIDKNNNYVVSYIHFSKTSNP